MAKEVLAEKLVKGIRRQVRFGRPAAAPVPPNLNVGVRKG